MVHIDKTGLDSHRNLHAEGGALPGEHPGRSRNPVIKVVDLAWLEFEKPDLTRAEAFPERSASTSPRTVPTNCTCGAPTRGRPA